MQKFSSGKKIFELFFALPCKHTATKPQKQGVSMAYIGY